MRRPATLVAAAAMALSTISQAKEPVIFDRWANSSAQLFIHTAMPLECDAATFRARDTWNAQGSRWVWGWTNSNYQGDYQAYTGRVTIAAQGNVPVGVPARTTPYGSPLYSAWIGINDAYLFWNSGGWYQAGQYSCPGLRAAAPADQFNYETVIAHELAHAFGFDHHPAPNNYNCLMTTGTHRGDTRTQPCAEERTALQRLYGQR